MGSASAHTVRECDNCGSEIRAYGHRQELDTIFCSKDCQKDHHRTNVECKHCGEEFEHLESQVGKHRNHGRYCSKDCMDKWRSENWVGENNPLYVGNTVNCSYCGDEFEKRKAKVERHDLHFCERACHGKWMSENRTGENHPRWKGGRPDYYGEDWRGVRRRALGRDNYECVLCGKGKESLGRHPDVHHIRPVTSFEDPNDANTIENVVTLCRTHHALVEGWNCVPTTD